MRRHARTLSARDVRAVPGQRSRAGSSFVRRRVRRQKPVTLKGVVVKWEMINPHGWITMDVAAADGKTDRWMVETSNPNGLMRLGWTKNSLKPGDQITVEAYRRRTGRTQPTPRGSRWRTAARCSRVLRRLRSRRRGAPMKRLRAYGLRRGGGAVRPARRRFPSGDCPGCRPRHRTRRTGTAPTPRWTSGPAGALAQERRRVSGAVHRFARRNEFRRRWRRGGGRARRRAAAGAAGTNTRPRPKPKGSTVAKRCTKIPKRAAICLAFRARSISRPGFIRCRSFRTRNTWRCCTKPCTTSASFPPTTARIRRTTGRGTETHAAAGKATRSSST